VNCAILQHVEIREFNRLRIESRKLSGFCFGARAVLAWLLCSLVTLYHRYQPFSGHFIYFTHHSVNHSWFSDLVMTIASNSLQYSADRKRPYSILQMKHVTVEIFSSEDRLKNIEVTQYG
jgi:hypothetical protein